MNEMSPTIEPAVSQDFLHVSALDRIAWIHTGQAYIPDGEHVWRVWCEYAIVLVARLQEASLSESGNIAGSLVMFRTHTDEDFLHKIMVHPDMRGRRIGTQLMQTALQNTTRSVLLTVDPENAAAVQLYQKFGFQIRRRIDGYYRPQEDRFLMAYEPGLA
jgi:phosphinothricin acetyltransferase